MVNVFEISGALRSKLSSVDTERKGSRGGVAFTTAKSSPSNLGPEELGSCPASDAQGSRRTKRGAFGTILFPSPGVHYGVSEPYPQIPNCDIESAVRYFHCDKTLGSPPSYHHDV